MRKGRVSNWIRRDLREAIYARDGYRCVYCDAHADDAKIGKPHSLDHKTPPSRYRGVHYANHPSNLLTACWDCNTKKGSMTLPEFLEEIGQTHRYSPIRNRLRIDVLKKLENERKLRRHVQKLIERGELALPAKEIDDDDIPF